MKTFTFSYNCYYEYDYAFIYTREPYNQKLLLQAW